ncbi:hypothetical protein Trydic_g11724 [Trypoxylus dichotomus]
MKFLRRAARYTSIDRKRSTVVNQYEIELHERLKEIITISQQDTSFHIDNDTTLELLQPFKPDSIELVVTGSAISQEDLEEYLEHKLELWTTQEGDVVDMEYKQTAMEIDSLLKWRRASLKLYRWRATT